MSLGFLSDPPWGGSKGRARRSLRELKRQKALIGNAAILIVVSVRYSKRWIQGGAKKGRGRASPLTKSTFRPNVHSNTLMYCLRHYRHMHSFWLSFFFWLNCLLLVIRWAIKGLQFPINPKNTNLVEDGEILLPVQFRWILFSDFRGEVENVSANQRPGLPSCDFDRPKNTNLVEDVEILLIPVKFPWILLSGFRGEQRTSLKGPKGTLACAFPPIYSNFQEQDKSSGMVSNRYESTDIKISTHLFKN